MAPRNARGATPFDRLRDHFDSRDRTCPECGHEDRDGGWSVGTDGGRVEYRHVCPRCDNVRTLRYRLSK